MRKSFFTAAVVALFSAPLAHAQSRVTLYGNVDGGLGYFSNVGGKSLYTSVDGNLVPDLFGLTGTEDLGGGLKAIFKLEAGYSLNSGQLVVPGQIFQRESKVGLTSDTLGTLTFGHEPSLMFDVMLPYSVAILGGFYTLHQGNFDEVSNTLAFNNSVKYVSPTYGGLSFGGLFGFGNQAGNFAVGRSYALSLQYKAGPLSLGAVYTNENNRFLELANFVGLKSLLGTPLPTPGIVADKLQNWGVGGTYALGNWLLHGLFTQSRISTPTGSGNANTIDSGVNYTFRGTDTVGVGASFESFGGGHWLTLSLINAYALSKRTSLYQQVMYQRASGENAVASMLGAGQASGHSQFGAVIGVQHFF